MQFTVLEPKPDQQGISFEVEAVIKFNAEAPQEDRDRELVAARQYFQRPDFKREFQQWLEKAHPGCGTAHSRSSYPVFKKDQDMSSPVLELRHPVQLTRPL